MNAILKLLRQLQGTFRSLSTPNKILYSAPIVLVAASLAYLLYSTNRTEYTTLFSRLSESDMAAVVDSLKKNKTVYQLTDTGSISVPKEQLYDIRLSLAAEGVPKGPGAGFEIFDQQKLGSTEYVQKINYQRALQGELSRTINQMNEVMESRVHLVLPEDSLFLEDRKPTSAAVVLKLNPGAHLNQRQIQGLVNLVAHAVKGLEEDRVTILSTDGQVIFKKAPNENPLQVSGSHLEFKNQMEENLRQKIQSMLEQVVGSSRVMTRVTTDLDFNQVRLEQDTYDPDSSVVRSQQRSTENNEGTEVAAKGNPDVPINMETKLMENQPKDQQKKFNRQRETVNYEINHINRKTVNSPGSIKKLSVAVIVDGPYENKTDANGKQKLTFVPRSVEEMKSLEEVVKKAVGYDDARNDQISVSNIPFATDPTAIEEARPASRWLEVLKNNQKILFNLMLTLLVFIFVVRPLMKKFQQVGKEERERLPGSEVKGALPPGTGLPGLALEAPEFSADSLPALRERALTLIDKDTDRAREVLRTWLREGT
jgi:flagellar M-ring protein FliF